MEDKLFQGAMSLLSVVLIAGAMVVMITKLAIFAAAFIVLFPFAIAIKWKASKMIKKGKKEITQQNSEYHL